MCGAPSVLAVPRKSDLGLICHLRSSRPEPPSVLYIIVAHMIHIRDAVPADAKAILGIYTHYIENTSITFETSPGPSVTEMQDRISSAQKIHAFLILENIPEPDSPAVPTAQIIGYAVGDSMNKRVAYRWSASTGICLAPSAAGKGLGRMLYQALIDRLGKRGYRQLFGIVSQPNEASNAIHAELGSERCAVLEKCGYKLGKWWDVWWYQKSLKDEWEAEPEEIQ